MGNICPVTKSFEYRRSPVGVRCSPSQVIEAIGWGCRRVRWGSLLHEAGGQREDNGDAFASLSCMHRAFRLRVRRGLYPSGAWRQQGAKTGIMARP